MSPFTIVPIVEGHGEVSAVPILIRRLAEHIDPARSVDVRKPIRGHRSKLVRPDEAKRFLDLAVQKLGDQRGAVLVIIDADDDCPAELGPQLVSACRSIRGDVPVSVVLAVCEFEAWFLAAAESLRGVRGLAADLERPANPEAIRDAKGWIKRSRTDGLSYSETTDQAALTAMFDLDLATQRSSSFRKLRRDVQRLMGPVD
jgi:hypothetical protein